MTQQEFILIQVSKAELRQMILECLAEYNAPTSNDNQYLTAKEAADFLRVSIVSIHNWKRDKGLKFYRQGRNVKFLKSDLLDFVQPCESEDKTTAQNAPPTDLP